MTDATPKPWERLENETPKAWEAFQTYLTMENRTYPSVVQALGKKAGYSRVIERWASEYTWQDRIRAYDNYLADLELKAREENILKSRKNRDGNVLMLQDLLTKKIARARARQGTQDEPSPEEIEKLIKSASLLHDEARKQFNDLPTQKTDNKHSGGLLWTQLVQDLTGDETDGDEFA